MDVVQLVEAPRKSDAAKTHGSGVIKRLAVAVVVFVLPAAGFLWQSLMIELPTRHVEASPRAFPVLIGTCLFGVSLAVLVKELIAAYRIGTSRRAGGHHAPQLAPAAPTSGPLGDDEGVDGVHLPDLILVVAAVGVYTAVFSTLGYLLASALFLSITTTYFSPKGRRLRYLVVAILATVALGYVFHSLLGVSLPEGPLDGVLWTD